MSPVDRFGRIAAILRRFASGELSPSAPEPWLGLLERAGIHPAGLPLCCQGANFRWIEPLRQALAQRVPFELVPSVSIDAIVAWSPLTYAHEVESWTLRPACERLPDNLLAIRGVTLQDAPELRELGLGWAIVGRLQLLDLPRLQALPGQLKLFGDLELDGLPELRELGPGITIHGNLTVRGCPRLGGLPPDLRVDGRIWMDAPGPGFQPGDARIVTPWPGFQPKPVAVAGLPAGALELAFQ